MAHWTNFEIRRLKQAYDGTRPSGDILAAMFPRHAVRAVQTRAYKEGLTRQSQVNWLRLAHEYFARREAGILNPVAAG